MPQRPTLHTSRLILRPFELEDALVVQALAGAYEVALTTLLVPHPYEDGVAEAWIAGQQAAFETDNTTNFAVTLRAGGALCGSMSLKTTPLHQRAEIGYWIGVPFWGNGYCTEALRAVVDYSFESLGLNRIVANHFANNPASGRVMQKAGMTHEGTLHQHYFKWGEFGDFECYGLVRENWQAMRD